MSSVEKGTIVKVTTEDKGHGFRIGDVAVSLPVDVGKWTLFEREDGYQQYLRPEHYGVIGSVNKETVKGEVLPSKYSFCIVNKDNDIVSTSRDRDYARMIKSMLGGKKEGFRIFQYAAVKEIR